MSLATTQDSVSGGEAVLKSTGNAAHTRQVGPTVVGSGIITVTTNATGANWQAFASQACDELDIYNDTGTDLEWGFTADVATPSTSKKAKLYDKGGQKIEGITNANAISVRRVDQSNTQVTATAKFASKAS